MGFLNSISAGLRALFHREDKERELDDELRGFEEDSAAEKMRRGMSGEQALMAARAEIGSANAVKHHVHSVGWESQVEILVQDIRHSLRSLLRMPGFTLVAIVSLALGIGANTAIFTLIKQVLLQSLPVRAPQELVTFGECRGDGILGGIDLGSFDMFTYDFARQLEANPGPFNGVAGYMSIMPTVSVRASSNAAAIQVSTSMVGGNYFEVLGAAPLLGRAILSSDATVVNGNAVVVISHHFWQQSLSSDPAIAGKTISINATPFTVIGVMPAGFHGITTDIQSPDLWVPLTMIERVMLQPDMLAPRSLYMLHMFARRNAKSSLAADQAWLDRQIHDYVRAGEGATIPPERQQEIERLTSRLIPGAHGVSEVGTRYGASLQILMIVVCLVLVIACANLANFLLARAVTRQRETATRLALGSSRGRIVRQSLMEALLLSLGGGMAGLGVAFAATRALISFVAQGAVNTPLDPRPDWAVLVFTLGVSVIAGVLFGLAPAIHAARTSAGPALNASARTTASSGGRSGRFWPKALVTTQIMLSLLLLVGAGLFLRTLNNLQNQDYGFERTHLLIADFSASLAGYKPEQAPILNQRLIERLSAIPGVRSAALSGAPPISMGSWRSSITLSGYTPAPKEEMGSALNRVSGRYFETAGIPIVEGRALTPADDAGAAKVAVVNQTLAKKFYPHGDAVGHMLKVGIDTIEGPWQIVGVARDSRTGGARGETQRMVYLPLAQIVGKKGEGIEDSFAYTIVLRTEGDPATVESALRNAMADVDPNLVVLRMRTIREHLETFVSHETLIARLTAIFALLALLLACIGLYGAMSFNVARRSSEIGIRIALGATGGGVQWMVLRESLTLFAAGVVVGIPAALASARLVRSQLYEMSPFDPGVFVMAVTVIGIVAVVSAWLPARRAGRVDPMTALRCE